jgi:flagellar basal body rod protein FlgG
LRVLQAKNRVDYSQGPIEPTGSPLDLALFGNGFFAVETASGEAYTRDGRFRLDEQGELVTQDGLPLAFATRLGGIDPRGAAIEVDSEGTLRQGAVEVGRLKLVDFADPSALTLDPRGYLRAPRGLEEVAYTARVRQGALEGANVDPIREIIALIEVQRSFEGAARAVSNISESYQRLNQRGQ